MCDGSICRSGYKHMGTRCSSYPTLNMAGAITTYSLLETNPTQRSIEVTTFKFSELTLANQKYLEVERKLKNTLGAEAVLVSVDSLEAVRKAYPNYFLDTEVFVRLIRETTRTLAPPRRVSRSADQRQLNLFK